MAIPVNRIVTTAYFPGREIGESLGIVGAECVLGINIFKDIMGGIRDIVGGRSGTHQEALRKARETCIAELAAEAAEAGADAVVSVEFDYSEFSGNKGGMIILAGYGTAVRFK
ncbi:MAG: YbjQ family protein [Gammaproteobacteria bacterium]|nr:YbjQ family protein [Gammaproteobacteria bacterium]MYF00873.1 YbjQ family protein [Gammaproteobacteria bacterium]MYG95080.1 YbjQ family protein [Gammaproteobacteria bacterium]